MPCSPAIVALQLVELAAADAPSPVSSACALLGHRRGDGRGPASFPAGRSSASEAANGVVVDVGELDRDQGGAQRFFGGVRHQRASIGDEAAPDQSVSQRAVNPVERHGRLPQRRIQRPHRGVVGRAPVGPGEEDPVRELEVVQERVEPVGGERRQRRQGRRRVGRRVEGVRDVEQQRAQLLERRLGGARDVLQQRGERRLGEPRGLGAVGHDRHLRGDEVGVGGVQEQASDQVDVERARDRLGEEERARRRGAGELLQRDLGQVVPGDVGDDVGRDVVLAQHVGAGPVGQVQEGRAIPADRLVGGGDQEPLVRRQQRLLEAAVERDVRERALVVDGQLGEGNGAHVGQKSEST